MSAQGVGLRIPVHVHPGSRRPGVGGEHGGALVVRVAAPAVDGRATQAVASALASAFGVRKADVSLVSGATSRRKIFQVADATAERLAELLAAQEGSAERH